MKRSIVLSCVALASSLVLGGSLKAQTRFDDLTVLPQHEREAYTVESLAALKQDQLDTLYASLDSGAWPDGEYKGTVVFDSSEANEIERLLAIVSPYGFLESVLKSVGVSIWKGKIFDRDAGTLTNRIGLIRQYPAKVFCGQSLLDARRESLVLDYNFAESVPGYNPLVDWAMTRKGLGIRDEIRMVHPGLYLGRAYIRGTFALNFIIERKGADNDEQAWTSSCRK